MQDLLHENTYTHFWAIILVGNVLMVSNIELDKVKSSVVEKAFAVGAILYTQLFVIR